MTLPIKNKVGRPLKYFSEDERREASLAAKRINYISQKQDKPKMLDHPSYSMLANARKRAKDQKVPFAITLADIPIPELCPLLGIPLVKGIGWYTDNSPTLDKIIPKLGYIPGNVQVISMRANRIKDNASFQEFEKIYLSWKHSRELL